MIKASPNLSEEIAHFISPTEPPDLRAIGQTSLAVEKKGCDVVTVLPDTRIGWQRKTWVDLVMSLDDGRLANSLPKMDMPLKFVVIEGKKPDFGADGRMIVRSKSRHADGKNRNSPRKGFVSIRYTRESLLGVEHSLKYWHGVDVVYTADLEETILRIKRTAAYFSKTRHQGLTSQHREAVRYTRRDEWGAATDNAERRRIQKINFLHAMGLGAKTAENLLTTSGGKIPLQWTWDLEDFQAVPLIGRSTAERLLKFFE